MTAALPRSSGRVAVAPATHPPGTSGRSGCVGNDCTRIPFCKEGKRVGPGMGCCRLRTAAGGSSCGQAPAPVPLFSVIRVQQISAAFGGHLPSLQKKRVVLSSNATVIESLPVALTFHLLF